MAQSFPWKRFWCRRESTFSLGDRGFLVDPEKEHGDILNPNLTTLDQLQAIPCLALLGEPGMGKSWSLSADVDAYLQQSPGMPAMRLDLRSFGSEDRLHRALFEHDVFLQWVESDYDLHLYADSLDECLLRVDNVTALLADELPKYPLSRLKLRIACRTASWPTLLENALHAGYGEKNFVAAELVPLRRVDVAQAATLRGIAERAFLMRVDELGIAPLAIKPVTLKILLDTFKRDGDLPDNVLDLYEKGCSILCEEQNESRRAAHRVGTLSPKERIAIASRIAAATQFCNRFAIWTGTEAGSPEEDIPVGELVGGNEPAGGPVTVTSDAVLETLGTGLFSSRGQERLGWSHQTYAEFLAARYCITHRLPVQQLRSLVFHPRRERVIPQMREVASWIALQNPDLFADIAEFDPEVLLGSAAPSLSDEKRKIATDALLKNCDDGEFLHVKHNLNLRNLSHPALTEQLRPVLSDRERSVATRYLAVSVASQCALKGLSSLLADISLSDTETHHLRVAAAYAIADIGLEEDRNRLEPLLGASREADPNDQLRGAALRAIYPGDKYDDSIWSYLESPRQSNFYGSYNSFLSCSVLPKLNANNLLAALRWSQRQQPQELGPIAELQTGILLHAFEHIEVDGVVDLLAQTVFERAKSGWPLPRIGRSNNFSETLANDVFGRRRFLEALFRLLDRNDAYLVDYPLSLLLSEDLNWLVDRVVSGTSPASALVEANLICRLACRGDSSAVDAVWRACQRSPILADECKVLFEPVSLDSENARGGQKSRADLLKEMNLQAAPALQPRCEAALQRSETGDVDAWLSLLREMSVDEGGTHYMGLRQMEVEKLPGWVGASKETRARMAAAAKDFLMQTKFLELRWFPSSQIPNGASAGVNALAFLYSTDPTYLHQQSSKFWAQWIPSLIADSRAGLDKKDAVDSVFRIAASMDPAEMSRRVLEQIQFESNEQQFFLASSLVDLAWSESLGLDLLAKLQKDGLNPRVQEEIVYKLIHNKIPGAKEWAEETIQTQHDSECGLAISKALLVASDDAGWSTLWPIIQADVQFGRKLLEDTSYGQLHRSSFTSCLNDSQLGDLYMWLLEQYPPHNRMVSGAMGPTDTIRLFRDDTLEQLKKRATFEACDALALAELRFPQHRWLRYHFDTAELIACASTWKARPPRDIIAMASDVKKRFVESSEQLLEAIIESFSRLQAELHGELASVGDLWNSKNADWWPKQEGDISEYVARHLKRDLEERGVIINREVQIRPGRRGEMPGQKTDVLIVAIPTEGTQKQLYGPITIVMEVKGSWNDGLLEDMEGQLRDRYMNNSNCRTGLYVVAHFKAARWIASDGRRSKSNALDIRELRQQLAKQAAELSGGVLIKSFVLDCSLDSTAAEGT